VLWNFVAKHSYEKQVDMIVGCQQLAMTTCTLLEEVHKRLEGKGYDRGLRLWRTPDSLSIVFRRPNERIVKEFSLANVTVSERGSLVDLSHLFIMPHVTLDLVTDLQQALLADDAFRPDAKSKQTPPSTDAGDIFPMLENAEAMVHVAMNRGFA
jgi:histidine decarboxylase